MMASENRTRDPLLRDPFVASAYDKETSESGGTGILGRIAKASGLAFNRIYRSEKQKIEGKKEKAKEDTYDEAERKKTAAQRADKYLARSKI